ncbi:MAG: hypothetical protein OK454_11985, partial [Thaumarchaeota archaeon]|nr:hypothetical protein [Nitrososphaerota archaeon]
REREREPCEMKRKSVISHRSPITNTCRPNHRISKQSVISLHLHIRSRICWIWRSSSGEGRQAGYFGPGLNHDQVPPGLFIRSTAQSLSIAGRGLARRRIDEHQPIVVDVGEEQDCYSR